MQPPYVQPPFVQHDLITRKDSCLLCITSCASEQWSALCQVTWFVHLQEIPEDSMPAAVNSMVDALLQAGLALLRDDRSLDQAYFAQLLLLFRVSVTVSHALIALGGAVCIVSAIIAYSLLCQEEASEHCRQACC